MSSTQQQLHSKFKIFTGPLGSDLSLGTLGADVAAFAVSAKAAAKSIGVEYLEKTRTLVVTLGYRDDEAAYPIELHTVRLGTTATLEAPELERLEKRMSEEASKLAGVICHELFITEKGDFAMVLMTAKL